MLDSGFAYYYNILLFHVFFSLGYDNEASKMFFQVIGNYKEIMGSMEYIEQQDTELAIAELDQQIQRMMNYVEQNSQLASTAVRKTLMATMRYRASLVSGQGNY